MLSNSSHGPASDSQEDKEAAQFSHRWTNYPLFYTPYIRRLSRKDPGSGERIFTLPLRKDMTEIKEPIDFVGINYYSGDLIQADPQSPLGKAVEKRTT